MNNKLQNIVDSAVKTDSIHCFVCDQSYSLLEPWVILNRYICLPQSLGESLVRECYSEAAVQICRYCAEKIGEVPSIFTSALQTISYSVDPVIEFERSALMQYLTDHRNKMIPMKNQIPNHLCTLCDLHIPKLSGSVITKIELHQIIVGRLDNQKQIHNINCSECGRHRVKQNKLDGLGISDLDKRKNQSESYLSVTNVFEVCKICKTCSDALWGYL